VAGSPIQGASPAGTAGGHRRAHHPHGLRPNRRRARAAPLAERLPLHLPDPGTPARP
jgi:hypothetical protein